MGEGLDWTTAVASAVNKDTDVHGLRRTSCRWIWMIEEFAGHGKKGRDGMGAVSRRVRSAMGEVWQPFTQEQGVGGRQWLRGRIACQSHFERIAPFPRSRDVGWLGQLIGSCPPCSLFPLEALVRALEDSAAVKPGHSIEAGDDNCARQWEVSRLEQLWKAGCDHPGLML